MFSQTIVVAAEYGTKSKITMLASETKLLDHYPLYQTINNYDFEGKNVKKIDSEI
jgi:hypothetical protein